MNRPIGGTLKLSALCDEILETLNARGGNIAHARGYAACVKLAQAMKLDHQNDKVLQELHDGVKKLEGDGRIVVVWVNERHAASIALVPDPEPVLDLREAL